MRREDRSSIVVSSSRRPRRVSDVGYAIDSSSLRAVPLFVPGGGSFVPACARRRAARKGRQGRPSCCPDVVPTLPGCALTALTTARGSGTSGPRLHPLRALEGASLVLPRPAKPGE